MSDKARNEPFAAGDVRSGSPRRVASAATGLRAVAVLEATKGALVLVAGFGLLSLVHRDAQRLAEEIVQRFHLNLAHHHPRILIDALAHLDDANLRLLAFAALLYSAVRFIEAYGLWSMRAWGQWFGIVSGGIYLPVEVYELIERLTAVKAVVLIFNVGIVGYLFSVRWHRSL